MTDWKQRLQEYKIPDYDSDFMEADGDIAEIIYIGTVEMIIKDLLKEVIDETILQCNPEGNSDEIAKYLYDKYLLNNKQ